MSTAKTIDALIRLYQIHFRSMPMYLGYAAPWTRNGQDSVELEVLQNIVADQKEMVDRISDLVIDLNESVRHGGFPMYFTGLHDLSFDFLLPHLISHQQRDIAAIEKCVHDLEDAPGPKALAEECLGAAQGHLDSLTELHQNLSSATAS